MTQRWTRVAGAWSGGTPVLPGWDYDDANPPWAYSDVDEFREHWPSGVTVVPIQTGGATFKANLTNTLNAYSGQRIVVELAAGTYHLTSFDLIGSSGDPKYAFGFWNANLRGLVGQGPDRTIIQMDAGSVSGAQLTSISAMTKAAFAPLQMGLWRLDGSESSPAILAGLTIRAADQNNLTSVAADLSDLFVPQPCPHQGLVIYSGSTAIVSHVRFTGAGRAMNNQPPFEMANCNTQYGTTRYYQCEFDGRRASALNAAVPRRVGPLMANNETLAQFEDCWFHHSNLSRVAINDQNRDTSGVYSFTRCKLEHISEGHNTDPALNGGASLGGWVENPCAAFESCSAAISFDDCIVVQDNPLQVGQIPVHIELATVGTRNPSGGRLTITGGQWRNNGFPSVDGFVTFRIGSTTRWALDGYPTTLAVYHEDGQRLAHHVHTGTWPPSAASLAAIGVTPESHYLIRGA